MGGKMILFDTRVKQDWSNAPAPRLCHVIKWNENDGFGFHLLADKKRKVTKPGTCICVKRKTDALIC
jgi:hypothetical protein